MCSQLAWSERGICQPWPGEAEILQRHLQVLGWGSFAVPRKMPRALPKPHLTPSCKKLRRSLGVPALNQLTLTWTGLTDISEFPRT